MGKRKQVATKNVPKMRQMLLSPNLTIIKSKDKKKKNSKSPPKSPSKVTGRPKPQSKASAKIKIPVEDKENANSIDNNNLDDSPITQSTKKITKVKKSEKPKSKLNNVASPEKKKLQITENKTPEKRRSQSRSNENSPTNNNLKSTPSKMSPAKEKDHEKSPNNSNNDSSGTLPLPDRPTSPRKSPGDRSGSSSPIKEGESAKGVGFKCKVCHKWFPNRYFQRKHMLMAHEDQLYECRVCSFTSVDPEKLKSHIIKLHVSKKEKADAVSHETLQVELDKLIDKKVPRKVMMEDGVALGRDVNSKMRYVCALCSRVYTSKYSLERHVRCHTLEKPYQCDVCTFSSSYREHMMRHITSVHLIVHSDAPKIKYIPKKKRESDGSDSSSKSPESLDNDESSSIGSSPGKRRRNILRERFECAVCGMRATHKTDLMDHIRTKHPNAHIQSLVNKDGSKVHLIVTNAKKAKVSKRLTIQCSHCSLIFHDTWKYKVHLRSHTGVKPFQCSICDLRATSKMTIRDHIHRKHMEADNAKIILRTVGIDGNVEEVQLPVPWREFRCEICELQCADKYSLKLHKTKEHPDIQPFSCTACEFKEKVKANMIIHCHEQHKDRNPDDLILRNGKPVKVGAFKLPSCDFCGKTFPYKSQLNIHTRLHTGEKELSCTHCDYQTNSKMVLSQHILKKHFGHNISSTKRSSKSKKLGTKKQAKNVKNTKKEKSNDQ